MAKVRDDFAGFGRRTVAFARFCVCFSAGTSAPPRHRIDLPPR